MTEQQRNTILSRWREGASLRQIARELHLARRTVGRVVTGGVVIACLFAAELISPRSPDDRPRPERYPPGSD